MRMGQPDSGVRMVPASLRRGWLQQPRGTRLSCTSVASLSERSLEAKARTCILGMLLPNCDACKQKPLPNADKLVVRPPEQ